MTSVGMEYSAAFTEDVHQALSTHLLQTTGQEDLCFALWNPSQGRDRFSALLVEVILPAVGERSLHENASFTSEFFRRALAIALERGCGLAFLHSHLGPGWQGMSDDDEDAEESMAGAVLAATGLPLLGLTLGIDGAWSARFWIKTAPRTFQRTWCRNVRVFGNQLRVTFTDDLIPPPRFSEKLDRTIGTWGVEHQATLARVRVGVIGLGSVGSIVSESLMRVGIQDVRLIDFDIIKPHNLDRTLHATTEDALNQCRKVDVAKRACELSATSDGVEVEAIPYSLAEVSGRSAAMDCDVLFSCVDRPAAREILNVLAYAHLIPVIDGGIGVDFLRSGALRGADWKAHTVGPKHKCLACRQQYDPALVSMDLAGTLDDPTYLNGLPKGHPLRARENVFPFSLHLAGMEFLQFLSLVIAPSGCSNPGGQIYHFTSGRMEFNDCSPCDPDCCFPLWEGLGDKLDYTFPAKHVYPASSSGDSTASFIDLVRRFIRRFFGRSK